MKTKHKIFSVLVVLAIVASLFVIVAPTASAGTVTAVTVTATPATASDTAGYSIGFTTATALAAADTVTVTFPSTVTLPATLSKSLISLGALVFTVDPLVNGQQIIITLPGALLAGPQTLIISQAAGIKNPAIAKTTQSQAYPVTVVTSQDATAGIGYLGVIPSYALSVAAGSRSNSVTVTGKGWTTNSSILITGGLSNAVTGGNSAADGTFSVTAYPAAGGAVNVTDGAGQNTTNSVGGITWALGNTGGYLVTVRNFVILPTVTITPTSGNIGSTVTVTGTDFNPPNPGLDLLPGVALVDDNLDGTVDNAAELGWAGSDDVKATIPINGITMAGTGLNAAPVTFRTIDAYYVNDDFTVVLTVPAFMPGGAKTVTVTDDGAGVPANVKTASGTFTVNTPGITVSPITGQPNTTVTITGSNFKAADTIGTTGLAGVGGLWWGQPGAPGAYVWNTTVITVNAAGGWAVTLTIPATAVNGSNPIVVVTANGTVASYGFIVGTRVVTISPSSGPMGSTVILTGSNMTATSAIAAANVKLAGLAWAGWPAGIVTDSLGNIPAQTLTVPMGLATGPQTVTVTDAAGITAVGIFTVTQPTISITPTTGYKGDTIVVTGSGWVPGMLGLAVLRFNAQITVLATPDASGAFIASFTVPATAAASNNVTAVDNYLNGPPAVTFTLAPASISISPTSGPVGTDVTVTGKGFLPQAGLQALTIGGVNVLPATAVVSDEIGAFSATLTVPGLAVGAQTIGATVGGINVTAFFTMTSGGASAKVQLKSISAQLVRVWGYSNGTWQMYDPADAVGSDLVSLVAGLGYFVNVNAPCTLVYGGNSTNLVSGWNLIGWR